MTIDYNSPKVEFREIDIFNDKQMKNSEPKRVARSKQKTDASMSISDSKNTERVDVNLLSKLQADQAELGLRKAELSRTREELQQSQDKCLLLEGIARCQSVVTEISLDAIIATDKDLNIISWNKAAETTLGWKAEEVLSNPPASQIRAEVLGFLNDDGVTKSIIESGSWVGEIAVTRKNGQPLNTLVSAGILWDNSGKFNGLVTIYHDTEISQPGEEGAVVNDVEIRANQRIQRSLERLHERIKEIIQAVAYISEVKDSYTAGHQRRVAHLSYEIAKSMGLSEDLNDGLTMASYVHDIGKIAIPMEILCKTEKLTEVEFDMIKDHTRIGYEILKTIEFPWPIAKIVLQHHERIDGSGYPFGIAEEQILLESRILAVADVVEAMSSDRPYRPAIGLEKALIEINSNKGILYDPWVVEACNKIFSNKDFKID
jgi:PAS domain S-box-containing protein/putative nucleotidyltransferase with HDIG domain